MFDLNLEVGERIVFTGTEQTEFFTEGKSYRVIDILTIRGKTHILLIDDANEENFITVPFFRKNFNKLEVTISTSISTGVFSTETVNGILDWEVNDLTQLTTLLDSLNVGYEILDVE